MCEGASNRCWAGPRCAGIAAAITRRGGRDTFFDQVLPAKAKTTEVEHHAAMPYTDVPAFMGELKQRQGVAAQALRFAILTAARTNEVIGAKWSEIALEHPDGPVWIIPASRMKARREHRVPLAPAVVELLRSLHPDGDANQGFVFIGATPGSCLNNTSLSAVLKRMHRRDITIHGFRSTFRDWAAERTGFPREVAELALAHAVGTRIERAYQRKDLLDKRRKLAEAWVAYC